jgi:hypothetical protein
MRGQTEAAAHDGLPAIGTFVEQVVDPEQDAQAERGLHG